jgi:hypothetical protein
MIGHLWRAHRWLLLGFVAAVALALFFGVRAAIFTVYWSGHQDEAIAGWMTPRYIAHSWEVPPQVIGEALGLAPDGDARRMTIDEVARARDLPVEDVAATVTAAIEAFRAGQ